MIVDNIDRPARQASPIVVRISRAEHHTDLEVVNHALAATGETRGRLTGTHVQRYDDSHDALVTLYRD